MTRWTPREWGLLAVALALVAVGAEPWTRVRWTVAPGFEAASPVPGWTGFGYRTALLVLALAGAGAVLLGRRRVGRAGLAAALAGVLLVPVLDRTGRLDGWPADLGPGEPAAGWVLATALLAAAVVLTRPGGTPGPGPAPGGAERLAAVLAGVLVLLSLLPWWRVAAVGIAAPTGNAWQSATGWSVGIPLAVFAALLRAGTRARRLAAGLLVAGAVALAWPWYRMAVPAGFDSRPRSVITVRMTGQEQPPEPPPQPVPRNDLDPDEGGPQPAAVAALAVVAALGMVVARRRDPGAG